MSDTCCVCFDKFNKSTRAPTECPYCHINICRTCLETYLLEEISDVPRCVNPECRNGWERDFLDGEFTRTFRLTTYKKHRETVLRDREYSRLPGTQEEAASYRNGLVICRDSDAELKTIRENIRLLRIEEDRLVQRAYHARRVVESFGRNRLNEDGRIEHVGTGAKPAREVAAFVKPCPAEDCKGFLSTAWKCGLCNLFSCPDCHDLKGPARDSEHTCDPDKVATVRLLARDSRNCPKCGVIITKLEGCDQMFCTACNTGFSWRTGKIADGPIHNPHYFAWLQRQGREAGAAPQAGPVNCETNLDQQVARALCPLNPHTLNQRHHYNRNGRTPPDSDVNFLIEAWRIMREEQDRIAREPNVDEIFRQLRVRFMIGEMDEDEWKIALQRGEKDANFQRAVRQVREVFVNAARDLIRLVTTPSNDKKDIRNQVQELIDYCNKSYEEISKRFGRKTPVYKINLS
jgi:hypothetical protein